MASGTDPSVLSDGQLFHICAAVFEEHAERLFVYPRDGRRLIAELKKRAAGVVAPIVEDVEQGGIEAVAPGGETILRVHEMRHRDETIDEWLPNPAPGRANIRVSVVDDAGMVAEMEFGNATDRLARATVSALTEEHAKDFRARGKAVS